MKRATVVVSRVMSLSIGPRAAVSALALLVTLTLAAAPTGRVAAQHVPSAGETALARQEFDAGMRAARETQWEEARQHFARSYELAPRPVTLLNLAGAQAQTGQLVAASESYRRFMATASERDAERFRAQAEQALAATDARIGHAQLRFDGLGDDDEVRLDDAPLSRASLSMQMPVDPGDHVITVRRRNTEVGRTAFNVTEGGTSTVRVVVPRGVPSPADAARADDASNDRDDATIGLDGDRTDAVDESGSIFASPWFWIITGAVVVAALTVGIIVATSGSAEDPFQGTLMPGSITVD